jgi:hypothetical protein
VKQESYDEMKSRASNIMDDIFTIDKIFARQAINQVSEEMVREDKVLILSDEEERLLRSFRSFKAYCKVGAVFKWQTRPTGELVVMATETGLVSDPSDLSRGKVL